MSRKLITAEFIERARKVHGDKYDYSKVNYVDAHTKVRIVCPIHGEFEQKPYTHLNGVGCKKCGYEKNTLTNSKTTEQFIHKAKEVHGDKYDYSKVEYKNNHTKVRIVCPTHGEFWQIANDHLNGHGCKKCNNVYRPSTEEFIERAKQIHGDKYDYSKVEYINALTKVCIICPTHGEFWQTPNMHLNGQGCRKCQYMKLGEYFTSNNFIEKAKEVHGEKYDYSKVEYKNNKTKVCIICPTHGEFYVTPNHHLRGVACPICNESRLERKTRNILSDKNIRYINGKHFDWLNKQHLDFYLPRYNIAIECQGEQHFTGWMKDKKSLKYIQSLDAKKKQLCEKNGVKLYYINYNDDVETKLNEIIEENAIY